MMYRLSPTLCTCDASIMYSRAGTLFEPKRSEVWYIIKHLVLVYHHGASRVLYRPLRFDDIQRRWH